MKKLLSIFAVLCLVVGVQAQKNGHKITFNISDLTNSELLIAYHYNGKHFISDTVPINEKGIAILEGEEPLQNGVYLAVFPSMKNQYFEFLVAEQKFNITTSTADFVGDMKFDGSKENTVFYADMKNMNDVRKQTELIKKQLETADEEKKITLQNKLDRLDKSFRADRNNLMEENKDLFYTDLLGLLKEIDIPDAPKNPDGSLVDSSFTYKYFKNHYWDYTDFSQEGIIRTPVFHNKMVDYIEKYTSAHPDSIKRSCDILLNQENTNDKVFQTILVTLLNKYANSKIMGHDAVYVHLAKEYYGTGRAYWAEEDQKNKIIERVKALEPLLIGQKAQDLSLWTTDAKSKFNLYSMTNDYTILYIWDPDCGHCKKVTPKLGTFYNDHKTEDIGVFAITTTNLNELDKWTNFINEHKLDWMNVGDLYNQTKFRDIYDVSSTPQVYVLNKDKEIIGKRIGVEQLEVFFYNYLKGQDDNRYLKFDDSPPAEVLEEGHSEHDGHNH